MNDAIIGHDAQVAAFLSAMRGDRPHHGWLFAGAEGLGKASLAKQLAARVLAEAVDPALSRLLTPLPDDHPTVRMMEAGSHPDFLMLERLPKDDKLLNKPKDEWPEGYERARSIKVDQVRELTARFATRPSLSDRRIVLIDSADDLETSGANALLKALEEPPQGTIFILVSHMPGRLLPTIRSRCRMLRFAPLDERAMFAALRAHHPQAEARELETLCALGGGAPGKALRHAGLKLAEIDAVLNRIAETGDPHLGDRVPLAQSLTKKDAQQRYAAFLDMVPRKLAQAARARAGEELAEAVRQWEQAADLARVAIPGSYDPYQIVMELCARVAALAPARENAKA